MFERFTQEARDAVVSAQTVARERGERRIGPEHLLLGVLRHPQTAGARVLRRVGVRSEAVLEELHRAPDGLDADALDAIGVDLDAIRRRAEETFGSGALSGQPTGRPGRGHIPFDAGAKKALELSLREALALKHRYIGTEHVVLGLARDGTAAVLLSRLAATCDLPSLRALVLEELADAA